MTTKDLVRQTLDRLPDDVTIDEVIERLYLVRKIAAGIRQDEAGEVIDHEEVKREFRDATDAGRE